MAETTTRPPMAEQAVALRDEDEGLGEIAQSGGAHLAMSQQSFIMTAQPVGVKRKREEIRRRLADLCAQAGEDYFYSWKARDRASGTMQTIEGPSVKLANDLLRTWGNCVVGIVRVEEHPDMWLFHAGFVDLETGANYFRPFRQRRSQTLGMGAKERDREQDIVFQVGTSKAIRNVVVNVLSSEAKFMVEQAKTALITYIEKNLERANKFIDDQVAANRFDPKRIEGVVGRARENWTFRDMAGVIASLKQVEQGFENIEDLFPPIQVADARVAASRAEGRQLEGDALDKAVKKKAAAEGDDKKPESGDNVDPDMPDSLKRGRKKKDEPAKDSAGDKQPDQNSAPDAGQKAADAPKAEAKKADPKKFEFD